MIRVNLLPKDAVRTRAVDLKGLRTVIVSALVAILLSSLYAVKWAQVYNAEQQLAALDEEIAKWKPYLAKNAELTKALQQKQAEYAEVALIDSKRTPLWRVLPQFAADLGDGVWVSRLSIAADGAISVKAKAATCSGIADTVDNLKLDPVFSDPKLGTVYLASLSESPSVDAYEFDLRARLIKEVSSDDASSVQ